MLRLTGQLRADNAGSGNVAVYQINESAQHVMAELGVPIFPCQSGLPGILSVLALTSSSENIRGRTSHWRRELWCVRMGEIAIVGLLGADLLVLPKVDDMHFPVVSQATYLFGDMALYYLYRVVEGTWTIRGPGGGC